MSKATARRSSLEGVDLACRCALRADALQAEDVRVLDLRGISQLTDFFVIASGTSLPQLKAIRDEVRDGLVAEADLRPAHREDTAESLWIVLDYIDVMVHIFHRDLRKYYALEDLWSDAREVDWGKGEALPGEGGDGAR
ncbi:MAG TPA: ribosome silencing factor [Verrucomicrobiales bacterium]|nr:ribosome silencing factor [Verrucomicrobiales bacterium]